KVLHVASPGVAERMLQEGRVQATIDHPNVVGVRDLIRVHGMPCLVMEYVDGPSLYGVLYSFSLNYDQLDAIAYDLMEGLAAAHARNLVHRDLKPQNVLLQIGADRMVSKIADFGLAKVRDGDGVGLGDFRTRSGQMMGTPSYMAPEQFNDAKTVDHRADIFALAAVLYEALTGEPPFGTDALVEIYGRSASGQFTPIEKCRPDVPPRIRDAIEGALRPKPKDRPQSVAEFRAIWQASTPVPANPWTAQNLVDMAAIRDAEHALSAEDDGSIPAPAANNPPGDGHTIGISETREIHSRKWPIMLLLGAITTVTAVLAGGLLSASLWWMYAPQRPAAVTQPTVDATREPLPPTAPIIATDRNPNPISEPTADEPTIVTPTALPAQTTTASPRPQRTRPPRVQPEPIVPIVTPTVIPDPVPQPAPTPVVIVPAPEPAVQDTNTATLVINGGVRTHLLDTAGATHSVESSLEPGDYTLWAFFDANEPTRVLRLSLTPGERRAITCSGAQRICR
ncbi:MAG: serine/threonine-protein kinase, partial [bacterium]